MENPAEGAYNPYKDESKTFLNTVSIQCRRWCSNATFLRVLHTTVLFLLLLTFFEPPLWCRDRCDDLLHLQGMPAGSTSKEQVAYLYPATRVIFLTTNQSMWIESFCLLAIAIGVVLRIGRDGLSLERYLRKSAVRLNRITQLVCLLLLSVGIVGSNTTWNPYLRMIMALSFLTDSQREIQVLIGMLPVRFVVSFLGIFSHYCILQEVFNVLVLLFAIMVFYAWFGVVMFVDSDEGNLLFPNLIEAMWTLWICVTTANYPDVMMPGYNENRWVVRVHDNSLIFTELLTKFLGSGCLLYHLHDDIILFLDESRSCSSDQRIRFNGGKPEEATC